MQITQGIGTITLVCIQMPTVLINYIVLNGGLVRTKCMVLAYTSSLFTILMSEILLYSTRHHWKMAEILHWN